MSALKNEMSGGELEISQFKLTTYERVVLVVLAISLAAMAIGSRGVAAIAELPAAYAIWSLSVGTVGKVSRKLNQPTRLWFTIALAVAVPAIASTHFLRYVTHFSPYASLEHFASSWYVLVPAGIIASISYAIGEKMMDYNHAVTGLLVMACLLFVPMYFGVHGVVLGSGEDGIPNEPTDPAVLKAMRAAGYHFTIYWLCIALSYAGMIVGMIKHSREMAKYARK